MNRFIKYSIVGVFTTLSLYSHSLILNSFDNGDGTMEIVGKFSTGASVEGAMVQLVSLKTTKIIFEKRMDSSGAITVNIPKEPYKIVLDSGPGHKVEKKGTVDVDLNTQTKSGSQYINKAFYITWVLSLGFIGAAFVLFYKRVDKK